MSSIMHLSVRGLIKPVFHPRVPLPFQWGWLKWMSKVTVPPKCVSVQAVDLAGVVERSRQREGYWLSREDFGYLRKN